MEALIEMFTGIFGSREEALAFLGVEAEYTVKETPINYYKEPEQETDDATD